MAQKRKRRASPKLLAEGEVLKRDRLTGNVTSAWGWVGSEVNDASHITQDHLFAVYGFSQRNKNSRCSNIYGPNKKGSPTRAEQPEKAVANGELEEDVIIISDEEETDGHCNKKDCKSNPFCLNYLGQEKWEDEDKARIMWGKSNDPGTNPKDLSRKPGMPVGLKNLGATCYANASLQVWFRDLDFRAAVFSCLPTNESSKEKFKESPIFQLQVTFAALQESIQKVYNPNNLVESLQLRTTEQQDAQEFSKLFITHLDTEFKKQSNPRVKSLVTDLFEGELAYATVCSNCKNKSERTANFLELEIRFQNKMKLGECIQSLLQPEELVEDNKYLCGRCESLQDAIRYTELRRLPPVLHFSLMRFVFDMKTLERKKSKNIISFPREVDMGPFLGQPDASFSTDVYELRGILLHKGTSAYHGHYEAQTYDSEAQSWFQFNDEVVTRINQLGDLKAGTTESKPTAKKNTPSSNSRKKQRVGDSEDEANETMEVPLTESFISSKDAYMLIYVKKPIETVDKLPKPAPSSQALLVIEEMNKGHNEECAKYLERESVSSETFDALRRQVMDVYHTWELSVEDEDLVIVNRKAVESWLSNESVEVPNPAQQEILCEHGKLDWKKAKEMKCLKRSTYEAVNKTGGSLDPIHTFADLCEECIKAEFSERLYQIEHPRIVAQFNQLDGGPQEVGYWISKPWMRDWLLQKPKMHTPGESDPPPDDPNFDQIRCEHNGVSVNSTARRHISVEACELLATLFPQWKPVSVEEETCAVCDVLQHQRKTNNQEYRKKAEEEKAKLKRLYDQACTTSLTGTNHSLQNPNATLAIVPSSFIRQWRLWLSKPSEYGRPESVDNSRFFCEHDMLLFDPSLYELEDGLTVILKEEWDVLMKMYSAGPLIPIRKDDSGVVCEIDVCNPCHHRAKTEWETTNLIIRIGAKDDSQKSKRQRVTYGRQSRSLRQLRRQGDTRRVTVTKDTTVKDIKIKIQEIMKVPTICQRLFYKSRELGDGSVTVGALGLLANDTLEFREQNEVHEISDGSDGEGRARDEGRGFDGTLLLGGSMNLEEGPRTSSEEPVPMVEEKTCPACTFINASDLLQCEMCGTEI